jgi:uncharacterized protein YbjT (DUF2867 family)
MILVTGSTGTVGREVVAQLAAAGVPTRALVRDPAKAHFDAKVQIAVGDLGAPDTLVKALDGVEAVFSLANGAAIAAHEGNLSKAAKQAGVKRLVKLSVNGAGTGGKNPILQWHDAGEQIIRESGLAWTFVRPSGFMSNALMWAGSIKATGKVFAPYGDGKMVPIHPKEIAAVSVKALLGGHEGKSYELTGSEALNMTEQLRVLSEASGRPIQYVPVNDEAAREGMAKNGMPPPLIDALLQMAAAVRAGHGANILPGVEQVLGRKGLTFAQWAQENAAAFR